MNSHGSGNQAFGLLRESHALPSRVSKRRGRMLIVWGVALGLRSVSLEKLTSFTTILPICASLNMLCLRSARRLLNGKVLSTIGASAPVVKSARKSAARSTHRKIRFLGSAVRNVTPMMLTRFAARLRRDCNRYVAGVAPNAHQPSFDCEHADVVGQHRAAD